MRGDSPAELHEEREPYRHIPRGLEESEPLGPDMFTTSTKTAWRAFNTIASHDETHGLTSPEKVMKKGLEKQTVKLLYSSCSNVILLSCGEKVEGDEHQADGLLVNGSSWAAHRP